MNVYDFDKTIYRRDSTTQFYLYCLRRKPSLMKHLPHQAKWFLRYLFKKADKTRAKQEFFVFFRDIGDIEAALEDFWDKNERLISKWYRRRDSDVVISASPLFIIAPMCKRLGIFRVLASPVNSLTGIYENGINCDGKEKVRRFREKFGNAEIDEFYSDSHSDDPLADISAKAYLVKGERLCSWN